MRQFKSGWIAGKGRKVFPRDPTQEWWIPQPLPKDQRDQDLERAYEKFEEIITECCGDSVDAAMVQTLMIAHCSLRTASWYTGVSKTTLARRRDLMIRRVSNMVKGDQELYETLLGAGSINELHEMGEPAGDESP